MADVLDPVPAREPVSNGTPQFTAVWVRWLSQLREQATGPYQPLDATLTTLAALTGTTDTMIYFTGVDVAALTALTAFMRTLLDDADAATARATLGVTSQLWPISQTTVTVNASNGAASITTPQLAPAGARLLGLRTQITTAFGTGNGLSAILIGDDVAVDRYGRQTTLTAGATTAQSDANSDTMPLVRAAYSATIVSEGGTFTGVGTLQLVSTWTLGA